MPRVKGTATSSQPIKKEPLDPGVRIAKRIYGELLKDGITPPLYAAIIRRVKALITEIGDEAQVEYICLALARSHGTQFSAAYSLNAGSYEYMLITCGVPTGAWKYALWLDTETDPKIRKSIEYWLGQWADADSPEEIEQIKKNLEKLSIYKVSREVKFL